MAARSPRNSTAVEPSEEGTNASASSVNGTDKRLSRLSISSDSPTKKKGSLPNTPLTIQPAPYYTTQSPVFSPQGLGSPNHERSYLLENLQRQHERGERLTHALSNIEVRVASARSKAEGKKLRKEATVLRGKVAEAHRQEQLILLRLDDIQNEDLNRIGFYQAQSAVMSPFSTGWSLYQPWAPMTLPQMSPIHPISPLTPLPPGIYHPTPVAPSPLTSPFWLGAQYPMAGPVVSSEPYYYVGQNFQPTYVPAGGIAVQSQWTSAAPVAREKSPKDKATKSVGFAALPQQGAYTGRRWSLADTFSPKPKDKRMSMPGLQTIWKDMQPEGQEEATS